MATNRQKAGGRPKNTAKRTLRGFNYSEASMDVLRRLSEKYRVEAPSYITLSDRQIIEALIHHADREELSFSQVFGITAESGK
jgi:hypothetical protein